MKKRMGLFIGLVTLGAFSVGAITATYQQQQNKLRSNSVNLVYSKSNPAPIGVSQRVKVTDGVSTYEIEICVKETIRGETARKQIKAANIENPMPRDDQEYIMARISIQPTYISSSQAVDISADQFGLYSEVDMEYGPLSINAPSPSLNGTLKMGDTIEGWACFMVDKTDVQPKIGYLPTDNGTAQAWFEI